MIWGANPMEGKTSFSSWILNTGFVAGLILSFVCFLGSAYYLHQFQLETSKSVTTALQFAERGNSPNVDTALVQFSLSTHIFVAQILLRSCGIFAGLAFGFLGFSLFLIGVQGSIDADASAGDKLKISLLRISPGALVMVAATFLIGICAVSTVPGNISQTATTSSPSGVTSGREPAAQEQVEEPTAMDMRDPEALDRMPEGTANAE